MMLYSDTLSAEDVAQCAGYLGMTLYQETGFGGSRKRRMSFVIRPTDDMAEHLRTRGINNQRVWAVTWEGHWLFMKAIFDMDPNAQIRSSAEHWRNRQDFLDRAERRARARVVA